MCFMKILSVYAYNKNTSCFLKPLNNTFLFVSFKNKLNFARYIAIYIMHDYLFNNFSDISVYA